MGVRAEELPHQIVKVFDGEYVGYETVLFGSGGSPGVWGAGRCLSGPIRAGFVQNWRNTHTGSMWTTPAQYGEERLRPGPGTR